MATTVVTQWEGTLVWGAHKASDKLAEHHALVSIQRQERKLVVLAEDKQANGGLCCDRARKDP